ncbi:MAG: ABC transporter substrate-binding protein [Clostridia bacterium]|nr:ABC transporter substrate-binding protein [Clostridia bacterium]
MKMRKWLSVLLVAVLVVASAVSLPASAEGGKVLRFALSSLKGAFSPILHDDVYDNYVHMLIFSTLATNDPGNNIVFDDTTIADSYDISEDHLTYTFHLKEGLVFSNGDPLTAEDVAFTYKMVGNPSYDGPRTSLVSDMVGYEAYHNGETDEFTGIQVIDPKTISFTLVEPYVAKIEEFAAYGILSKNYYEKDSYDEFKALNGAPVGCGPFMLDTFDPGQAANLVRNPNWTGKQPKLDGVTFLLIPPDSQIMALTSGQCDLIEAPGANQDSYNAMIEGGASVIRFIGLGYNCMMLNHQSPKLSDLAVRKALMHGFDREGFIQNEYEGFATPCLMLVYQNPEFWAYPKDTSNLDPYAFDPELSKTILEEAGWTLNDNGLREKDGVELSLTMYIYMDAPWPEHLSALLVEQWADIGVELNVLVADFDTVMDKAYDERAFGEFDLWTQGWQMSSDPDMTELLGKEAFDVMGGFNPGGYYNEDAEALFKAGRQEFDPVKRAEIYAEWALLSNQTLPMLFNATRDQLWGAGANVTGFEDMNPFYNWVSCIYDVDIQ